ncbi:uncharacterized protein LOC130308429 [Hyla sarda]|uniref:uncharacterized protein LOC130308429 n=1 Tax=Hyla sarda TaxID=327740 RepID=UPI0024C3C037|nr:uncharacterized protein LOC130308429 [Hyla sarda]
MDFSRTPFYTKGIVDHPPPPSLFLIPSQPSYDNGQKITLICSPPNNIDAKGIRYYKNFTEIQLDKIEDSMTHYTKILSKEKDEGVYRCGYWVIHKGSEILSYGSNEVNIMITDTTPSWIYYITGVVVFVVILSLCLLYKRTQKGPHRFSETQLTSYNPGQGISNKTGKDFASSLLVQNQLNNPLYSVICQSTTPGNEQLLSHDANTWMMSDLKKQVSGSLKTSSASLSLSQNHEEAHIYSEIETETCHFKNNDRHLTINSVFFTLYGKLLYLSCYAVPSSIVYSL